MNTPLPYKHIQDLSERQLLQVIVDKLCCVAGKYILDIYGGAAAAYSLRSLSKDTIDVVRVRRSVDNAEADFTAREITNGTLENWVNADMPLPLDTATAAAAYSLRNLKTSYTGSVIRVRRSSDNAEADFTANEVADGTMLNWVNADVVKYTSDFTSGNEDLSEANGIGTDGETIDGVSDAYKFTLSGGNGQHFAYKTNLHSIGKQYSITFDVYIPSTNANCDGVILSIFGLQDVISTNTLDQWVTLTSTYTANYSVLNFFALDGASKVINADGDVFYLKNIVVTQTTADGLVTTWYDQAGSNDATQATAANQPKIVDAGVLVEENGKPAVSFDGVDDYFTDISGVMGGSVNGIMISVHKTNDGVTTFDSCQISEPSPVLIPIVGNNVVSYAHLTSTRRIFATSDNFYDRQLLVIRQNYNSNHALYINGSLIDSQTDSVSYTDTLKIGRVKSAASFAYYNNNLQEIIIYNSDQSSNRTNIETNINDHYSIYP